MYLEMTSDVVASLYISMRIHEHVKSATVPKSGRHQKFSTQGSLSPTVNDVSLRNFRQYIVQVNVYNWYRSWTVTYKWGSKRIL